MLLSCLGLVFLSPIMIVVFILCYFDTGKPIFAQERIGYNKKIFKLYKFRTMSLETKSIASHLVNNSNITKIGSFMRKTKLDELPQLYNVLVGEMSFVGPRPNLINQKELIFARDSHLIYSVKPGITGLSQIKNIDMSTPRLLAETDKLMIKTMSLKSYFIYIFKTISGAGSGDAAKN